MSRMGTVDIVNAATLEKVVLGRRIAEFLKNTEDTQERIAVENVARMLAQDVALQVRETLAFELRSCKILPYDLAARIASDVESVASPFLASTEAFTDEQLAALIPHLQEHAHVTLSRRSDLGIAACEAIITVGGEKAVTFLVRNKNITLLEPSCSKIVKRFGANNRVMEYLSQRADLPLSIVEQLVLLLSAEYQDMLVETYGVAPEAAHAVVMSTQAETVWRQVETASPAQIHAYVIDLKKSGRLTQDMALEIVERGCLPFLESMLALAAGLTLGAVREYLYSSDIAAFITIMKKANVGKSQAQRYRQMVLLYRDNTDWPIRQN